MTSCQETDGSAHLHRRSTQHYVRDSSRFDLHSPKALSRCFPKQHGHLLGQPIAAGVRRRVCVYASADWLSCFVSQRMAKGQLASLQLPSAPFARRILSVRRVKEQRVSLAHFWPEQTPFDRRNGRPTGQCYVETYSRLRYIRIHQPAKIFKKRKKIVVMICYT